MWHFKYKHNTRDKDELDTSHLNLFLGQREITMEGLAYPHDESLGSYKELTPLVEQISRDPTEAGYKLCILMCSAHKENIMNEFVSSDHVRLRLLLWGAIKNLTLSGRDLKEVSKPITTKPKMSSITNFLSNQPICFHQLSFELCIKE